MLCLVSVVLYCAGLYYVFIVLRLYFAGFCYIICAVRVVFGLLCSNESQTKAL